MEDPIVLRSTVRDTPEQLLAAAMGMWGLTDIHSFWDPELETKALLGWSKDQIVLAFRGTASFSNALLDLKVGLACLVDRSKAHMCMPVAWLRLVKLDCDWDRKSFYERVRFS